MIALYLIAAHLVGDFVLQTRWQAAGKFDDVGLRLRHVTTYSACFIPVVSWAAPTWWRGVAFIFLLELAHFLTDSRRFRSTLGDVIAWHVFLRDRTKIDEHTHRHPTIPDGWIRPSAADRLRLKPNPWDPIALMLDQTFHVVQIAVLAGVFLS